MLSENKISAPTHKIICDNALDALKGLSKESIDMTMTSPPYWGLRDYGEDTANIWGGDKDCEHRWLDNTYVRNTDITAGEKQKTNKGSIGRDNPVSNAFCSKCNAWRGQLGLEPTPELYIEHLRMMFVEVKRVLKKTGTCWVNIGDSYSASSTHASNSRATYYDGLSKSYGKKSGRDVRSEHKRFQDGLPQKCMVMIPERFAFMMLDLGYILRNKIIWRKPNPMPSSVKDRFNTTYEMLYFFSKSHKYWFDLDAVREEHKPESLIRVKGKWNGHREPMSSFQGMDIKRMCSPLGKNPGDVIEVSKEEWLEYCNYLWDLSCEYPDFFSINTQSFPEAHFAVFPGKLCEKPILAGCPESGIILDPFGGSGTISIEAEKLNRSSIIVDIKKEYCKMALKRLSKIALQTKLDGKRSIIECINF